MKRTHGQKRILVAWAGWLRHEVPEEGVALVGEAVLPSAFEGRL
jgi:hypothetical protein